MSKKFLTEKAQLGNVGQSCTKLVMYLFTLGEKQCTG
jgi:hypothetical protein